MVTKTTFKKKFPDVKVQKLQTEVVFSRKHVEDTVLQMCGMMGLGLLYYSYSNKWITVYTSEKMKKEWTMEILTALQWAKKGFIPNEGAEGTEQWTNCYYSAKAVYFKDCEVHEDKEAAKAILSAKRKEYRDVAKKREEKRKQNAEYRGKMKTHWQWLQEGAYFYVCGDASKMAKDVEQALLEVIAKEGNLSPDEAEDYLNELREEKRYQRDVY